MAEGASSPDYGSKFFGSSLVKFIAFVRKAEGKDEEGAYANLLRGLKQAAEEYRGQALFAYCVEGTFPEASTYLNVDANRLPALYFYDPHTENRLASPSLAPLEPSEVARFVSAVLLGTYLPTPKSEPAPAKTDKGRPVPVHRLVGTTFLDEVGVAGKDVLVLLTTPFCQPCLDIATSFELLGKAFQSEPRVVLAKMDTQLNDLPPGVKVHHLSCLLSMLFQPD
jgi:thiol-disulfide isomerase/thioredoxin